MQQQSLFGANNNNPAQQQPNSLFGGQLQQVNNNPLFPNQPIQQQNPLFQNQQIPQNQAQQVGGIFNNNPQQQQQQQPVLQQQQQQPQQQQLQQPQLQLPIQGQQNPQNNPQQINANQNQNQNQQPADQNKQENKPSIPDQQPGIDPLTLKKNFNDLFNDWNKEMNNQLACLEDIEKFLKESGQEIGDAEVLFAKIFDKDNKKQDSFAEKIKREEESLSKTIKEIEIEQERLTSDLNGILTYLGQGKTYYLNNENETTSIKNQTQVIKEHIQELEVQLEKVMSNLSEHIQQSEEEPELNYLYQILEKMDLNQVELEEKLNILDRKLKNNQDI